MRRALAVPLAALVAAPLLAAAAPAQSPPPPPVPPVRGDAVTVTVNANAGLGAVHEAAYGANAAIWDAHMNDPEVARLYRRAGIAAVRYPGGSYGDLYHWKTHTAPGGTVAPGTDFDAFMRTVRAAGAQPVVIANYGTGTPEEAAGWVRYANVTKKYGVKYWEIGNELYGNGHYGATWESDDHPDKSPAAYARNALDYVRAMKAVDPAVKVGAVLTIPGSWPDGVVAAGDSANWNHTVIPVLASEVDFFTVHWYPGTSIPDTTGDVTALLASPPRLAEMLAQVRADVAALGGRDVPLALTEVASNIGRNVHAAGLFAADAYLTALENGVFTVDWFDTHNTVEKVSTIDGETDFQDIGFLSLGQCADGVCEPPVNTPFPSYHGIEILGTAARPGDDLIRAASDQPKVAVHAVRRAGGDLSVVLINKDPATAYPVRFRYDGFTPSGRTPVTYAFTRGADSIVRAEQGGPYTTTLPPYSVTTMTLSAAKGPKPAPAPGTPTARGTADGVTVSWPAVGGPRADRYEVYRQVGTETTLLGTTRDTSLTLSGLEPGAAYTVNVLARDRAGRLSRPSAPVTFTAPTPPDSACAVRYRVTQGWGRGFVATVTVTNRGAADVSGWTLAFRFPVAGERVSSGSGGTWTSEGQDVRVVPGEQNGTIPAGGSISVGFVGANEGAYPSPTVFRLNGAVCSTL
ncbi:cellulose binding domain-containing protein [Microbispora triticiradicis]|uniref:Alpha-L-arabinofuranosidase n=2 Tax=Microbispora TaxID=2005 RepID=A0ABY3LVU3_9ACTN|nr:MULTISPECIES: cellulose binding domain-containing protein [Microbispora]TLP57947.1 alpha-L-arabinofuranosidase [Microbispora fusca]TYB56250.1 alpha-L-arabinofuranosidase [Microbispora tritici]